MEETCKRCYSWTGRRGDNKYRCYCGNCPAKIRDDKEKNNPVAKRIRAENIKRLEGQIATLQSRLNRLRKGE